MIEEVASLLEEVIIINDGKLLLVDHVENLLAKGYTISGHATLVDEYIKGKNVLATESIGGLKTASILDESPILNLSSGLEVSKLDLQQMFIHLTNS